MLVEIATPWLTITTIRRQQGSHQVEWHRQDQLVNPKNSLLGSVAARMGTWQISNELLRMATTQQAQRRNNVARAAKPLVSRRALAAPIENSSVGPRGCSVHACSSELVPTLHDHFSTFGELAVWQT